MERDCDVARLSLADDQGQEYYAIVPVMSGKKWRERRETALDAIDEAIVRGEAPGEVRVSP